LNVYVFFDLGIIILNLRIEINMNFPKGIYEIKISLIGIKKVFLDIFLLI
jgi:hypothetical protein